MEPKNRNTADTALTSPAERWRTAIWAVVLKIHRPKFAHRTTGIGAVGSQTGKAKMTPIIQKKSMVMFNNVFGPRALESADARDGKGIKAVNIPSISENAMAET